MLQRRYIDQEVLARMLADVVLVNVAFIVALVARILTYLWLRTAPGASGMLFLQRMLHDSVITYLGIAPILTIFCLVIFTAFGFYTFGRAYQGRWKLLIILQAVTLSYLALGATSYLLTKVTIWLPRSVWLSSWALTLAFIALARLWNVLWLPLSRVNRKPSAKHGRHRVHDVVVVGGAGYIGSILVRKLLARGYHVTVLDALVYGDDGIRALYDNSNFDLIQDDFRNIGGVVQALQGADAVFHLGAVVGDPACALNERLTLEINLAATRMIAEAARGLGIERFIFASTCSVYGASEQVSDERSSLNPVSLYARSKIDAEQALLSMVDSAFAPTVLRFATIFGLSPRPRFDLVVNILAAQAARDKRITIFGGDQWRPFIHVDDVASALVKCLEAPIPAVKGQIFNIGSDDQNYRIKDIGDLVQQIIPDAEVVQQGEDVDRRNYRVSFAKVRRQLNFTATHTVADGIREIQEAVAAGSIVNFRESRYSNVALLSESGAETLVRQSHLSSLYGGLTDDESVTLSRTLASA